MNYVEIKYPKIPEPTVTFGGRNIDNVLKEIANEAHDGLETSCMIVNKDDFFNKTFSREQACEAIEYLEGKLCRILDILGD